MSMLLLHQHLSFSQCPFFHNPIKTLHFLPKPPARASTVIRMGGGPRTYPGGVSKWQWKRMQAKKAKQLLKARLCRERQIYEMRKRAELKAAVSELERPWEVVERVVAPNLFSVGADEQVKVLADRFQKPGGFDMWSERDGPVLFESPDELPSARFFPKGVVHSVKPYRRVDGYGLLKGGYDLEGGPDEDEDGGGVDGNEGLVKGNDFGGDLREMGNGGKRIEFGGGMSENGGGRKGIDFGGDGREVSLEGFDGFGFGGSRDGECFSSSSFASSYGREGIEFGVDLRGNRDGRGFLLESDDGSELESDDGEGSFSSVSYGRNGVKGDGGFRRKENGRRFLSDDVGQSGDERRSSCSTHGRNAVDDDGRLRRNEHGRRFLSSSDGERSSRLNYGKNGVDGDGRTRRNGVDDDGRTRKNGSGRRFLSDNVDRSSDGERSSLNYGRNVVDDDDRLRRNGNGRRVLSDDVGRSSDGGRSSRSNYQRRAGGRMRRIGNGSLYSSKGVDGADDVKHSPHSSSSGRYGASFDGRMRNKGSGRRVLSKDVNRSGEGGFRSKENERRFMSKDVDESNGVYSMGAASVRKQRGGNSIRGRSRGKYSNRISDYASRRGRNANSEVYDMGLQQDGSYGFLQKHEQPDSTGW